MKKNEQLSNLYRFFCEAEGSQHIASEYAFDKINGLVKKFQVKGILEVGLGIGSISGILLALNRNKPDLDYVGTEENDFCLNALAGNLKEDYSRLRIYSDLIEIPANKEFDLIIIDGKDQNLQAVKALISKNGILVIEGDRMQQQNSLQQLFPDHKYTHSISLKKNKEYSPFPAENWQGGIKIIFVNPTMKQLFWWFKEKYFTKIKYQYPGRYMGGDVTK
ncbi:hypothetical protein [Gillisia limnaea]|uniref:Methyltransferase small domain-containing protein n=1 Tax=Gillisia limnaea (strain DSM 15749 / LMG 21470 / R-8282) TaxID=865937 RepID=H2BV72_GILLR|nr:hypothetical protein [Gillisia limnaea]EHQ01737.1 hypothetical protein Gilli_1061 [Gillisia limnaea DSM 15749]